MAGMAALRGGAGLVRLAVPEVDPRHRRRLRAVVHDRALALDPAGRSPPVSLDRVTDLAEKAHYQMQHACPALRQHRRLGGQATAVACGPGLGRSLDLDRLVVRLYQEIAKPMVFDADALNALAAEPEVLARPGGPAHSHAAPRRVRAADRPKARRPNFATTPPFSWRRAAASWSSSRAIARW